MASSEKPHDERREVTEDVEMVLVSINWSNPPISEIALLTHRAKLLLDQLFTLTQHAITQLIPSYAAFASTFAMPMEACHLPLPKSRDMVLSNHRRLGPSCTILSGLEEVQRPWPPS